MKKIGLVLPSLNGGGAERAATNYTKMLSEQYDVYLILFETTYMKYDFSGTLVDLNVPSSSFKIVKILNLFRRIVKLKRIKRALKLDICISFLDAPNLVNTLSYCKQTKTIASIRNNKNYEMSLSRFPKLYKFVMKFVYKKSDLVMPVSYSIKEQLVSDWKIFSEKITVLHNSYDIEEIVSKSNNRIAMDRIGEEDFTFIALGRHKYQKGYWHLLKAFKKLSLEQDNIHLVIVGRYDSSKNVNNYIVDNDLESKVSLIEFDPNPYKYLKQANCFVLSSLFEGFPNALVEAMVCGVPIISANCTSGPKEILGNIIEKQYGFSIAEFGILVDELSSIEKWDDSFDAQDLYNAMKLVLQNDDLRIDLAKKSKTRSYDFSLIEGKRNIYAIIEKVL